MFNPCKQLGQQCDNKLVFDLLHAKKDSCSVLGGYDSCCQEKG
jgi:hypothetical protein